MLNHGALSLQANRGNQLPDMSELHRLLSQALGRRGQHIQTAWRSTDKSADFILDVISNTNGGDPKWRLFREQHGNRVLLFDYPSCDVLLVHNFMASSCADAQAKKQVKSQNAPIVPDTPPPFMGKGEASDPAKPAPQVHTPGIPSSGSIDQYPLDQLLQILKTHKLTGKLEVRNDQATALLYVRDGLPIDATASDTEGDDAIVELLTWKVGQFTFEPRVLRNSHTVHQPIESLLAQSKTLSERTIYLHNAGVKPTSTLSPKDANLTEEQFNQRGGRGAPVSPSEMFKFYRGLDGKQTIEQMLHSLQIPRVQLIHLIYHLAINGLIKINNQILLEKTSAVQPRMIETSAIQSVMMSLRRMETGMFIYPAFLYFLEQEYFRCYRSKTPLSVIVFEMRVQSGQSVRQMLPAAAMLDAVLRISQLKRHVDLLAHYDAFDYALLLPNTKANGAQIFAKRLVKALTETPLAGEVDASHLSLALGCASMPEDFTDLSELLGAADMAMAQSRDGKRPVVMFRDIKPISL
jgi:hypothetical protein